MSDSGTPINCATFEAQVADYLENDLTVSSQSQMNAHQQECARCAALLSDLQRIAIDARALPTLTPTSDLWPGISSRLDTPVVTLDVPHVVDDAALVARRADVAHAQPSRMISMRVFAAAAALLIAVSSGVTWMLVRPPESQAPIVGRTDSTAPDSNAGSVLAPAPVTALGAAPTTPPLAGPVTVSQPDTPVVAMTVSRSGAQSGAEMARSASRSSGSVDAIYEREIRSLRRIVDERMGDLDSTTVVEIERNLAIIDRAIGDSRRALERDPRSRFLSTQLDRALENKLATLRRVALL